MDCHGHHHSLVAMKKQLSLQQSSSTVLLVSWQHILPVAFGELFQPWVVDVGRKAGRHHSLVAEIESNLFIYVSIELLPTSSAHALKFVMYPDEQ